MVNKNGIEKSTLEVFFNPNLIERKKDYIAFTREGVLFHLDESGKIVSNIKHTDIVAATSFEKPDLLREKLGFSREITNLTIEKTRAITKYLKRHGFPYQEEKNKKIIVPFWLFAILCCHKNVDMKVFRAI